MTTSSSFPLSIPSTRVPCVPSPPCPSDPYPLQGAVNVPMFDSMGQAVPFNPEEP